AAGTARGSVGAALSARWLQWVGRHSYAWYLWHWPLLVLGGELRPDAGLAVRVGLAVAALALSVVTRAWIEEPCRRATAAARHPRITVAAGLAAVLLFVAGAAGLRWRADVAARTPRQHAYTA